LLVKVTPAEAKSPAPDAAQSCCPTVACRAKQVCAAWFS